MRRSSKRKRSAKMLISLEGAHCFYVSIFGEFEHLRELEAGEAQPRLCTRTRGPLTEAIALDHKKSPRGGEYPGGGLVRRNYGLPWSLLFTEVK